MEQPEDGQDAADVIAVLLVSEVENVAGPAGAVWLDSSAALGRQQVWTVLGMISAGLHLNTVHALVTLQAYAYSHDSTVDEIARRLVDRELVVEALTK